MEKEQKIIDLILQRIERLENKTSGHFSKIFDEIKTMQLNMKDLSVDLKTYKKLTWLILITLLGIAGWIVKINF
jgi:hypothetical protein